MGQGTVDTTMTSVAGSDTGLSSDRLPGALALVACVLIVALPLAMTLANRSAPLIVLLAAAVAATSAWLTDRDAFLADALRCAATPLAAAAALALAYALTATLWSPDPVVALGVFAEAALSLAGGIALAFALPRVAPRGLIVWVAAGVGLACVLVIADMALGLPLRRALTAQKVADYAYNRPLILFTLLLWPALTPRTPRDPSVGHALAALLALACLRSDSGAATLGLAIGLAAYGLALALPLRLLPALAAGGFAFALLLAPFAGDLAGRAVPDGAHEAMEGHHSRDRIEIWQTFQEVAARRPLGGTGFGSSGLVVDDAVAAEIPPEHRAFLTIGHPHNGFLQVWAELGALGAGFALLVGALGLRAMRHLPPPQARAAFALSACACGIALVGHGAWQGWWIASAAAAVALIRVGAARHGPKRNGSPQGASA